MSRIAAVLVLVTILTEAPTAARRDAIPPLTPVDTFMTGSELILFGKDVPPIYRNGQSGYLVACNDSVVSINGIVFFNKNAPPPKRLVPIDSEIERKAGVLESAINRLRPAWNVAAGEVTIDGKTHKVGDTFLLSVPDHKTYVRVKVDRSLSVEYEDERIVCAPPEANEPVNPVKVSFESVLKDLHGRRLVVMGSGYSFTALLSDAPRVRASLAKIAASAEVVAVDEFGRKYYKPVTIDGYMWTNSTIRDFVDAASSK